MAATVYIYEYYGAGPSTQNVTSVNTRFMTSDGYSASDTTYPLVKPEPAGTNYSYWKHFALYANTSPSGTINNVKWYTDGTISWTGITVKAGTVATYDQATGTQGTTGDEANSGHSQTPTMTTATTYTSASPLSVTGSISNPSTGIITNYVVLQAWVADTAVAGTVATETVTWRYDET